jgi:hypothetical protein
MVNAMIAVRVKAGGVRNETASGAAGMRGAHFDDRHTYSGTKRAWKALRVCCGPLEDFDGTLASLPCLAV